MTNFSGRNGFVPPIPLQKDRIDIDLKNALWDIICEQLPWHNGFAYGDPSKFRNDSVFNLYKKIWVRFLKWTVDEIPEAKTCMVRLKNTWRECEWYRIYDLLEIIAENLQTYERKEFTKKCNAVLQENNSAYKFAGDIITPIVDELQLNAVEDAFSIQSLSSKHIKKALKHLSDRQNPDFENSIKESILAVESELRIKLNAPNGIGSKLLEQLKHKDSGLHAAFIEAMIKLYSYSSDASGIRHANKEDGGSTKHEDALCMVVICSALIARINALSITL